MEGEDQSPEMQMAKMQIEALTKELNQVVGMLQRVEQSIEAQEVQIKAYDAETKRISAVQAGMTPEQIQDIVMGTIAAAMDTGDLVKPGGPVLREMPEMPPEMGGMPPDMGAMPPQMPPGGPMQ
jgi:heterodisulfide reductase subunit A-like polyferredoxin